MQTMQLSDRIPHRLRHAGGGGVPTTLHLTWRHVLLTMVRPLGR